MDMMDDEASNLSTFDIYSDLLIEKQTPSVSVEQLEKKIAEYEAKVTELTEQVQNLQSQYAAVVEENKVLKTNISELYKTAQAELKRKDRRLEDLTQRLSHWEEYDLKSSINNRLRNIRKTAQSSHERSNGVDHGSRGEIHKRRSPESSRGRHSPHDKENSTRSSSTLNSNHKRNETSLVLARERNSTDQSSVHLEKPSERTCINDTNDQSMAPTGTYKEDNESKKYKRNESENLSAERRLHNYKIPKKSSSSGTSSRHHRSSSRERAECDTSLKVLTSKKIPNNKKSPHKSLSPSRHTRERKRYSHSPGRGQSNERSKSGERSSRHTERGARRRSEERAPGRKRRRPSSERRSVSFDSELDNITCEDVPRKRHKRQSNSETCKLENNVDISQRNLNHKLEASSDYKVPFGTILKENQQSKMPGDISASGISNDEHRRRRHESSRTNKSVKRAKELLHKMHSTPQKHKEHKDHTKKHKHRRRHSSSKHKSKEGTEDTLDMDQSCSSMTPGAYEDEEIPEFKGEMDAHETGIAPVKAEHRYKRHKADRKIKSAKRAKEILHKKHGSPKKHRHKKDNKMHESNETTGDTDTMDEQKPKDNKLNLDSVPKNTFLGTLEEEEMPMCAGECSLEVNIPVCSIETSLPYHDSHEKVEKDFAEGDSEVKVAGETSKTAIGTAMEESSQALESSHTKSSPACKNKEAFVEREDRNSSDKQDTSLKTDAQIKTVASKQMLPLEQPDTAKYGYSSEHETVLLCGPSSQEEDSFSEGDSRSASFLSSSLIGQIIPSHETVGNWLEGEIKAEVPPGEVCENVSLPENDGILHSGKSLEPSTSPIQPEVFPATENNSELCQTQTILETKVKQPNVITTSDNHQSTSFSLSNLKPLPSPIKNTTDSFSEKIREVFGSNSFLESDDLESSKEMQVSFRSADKSSLLPETSNSCLENHNFYKHSKQSPSHIISEVTPGIPKDNSVVCNDLDRCCKLPLNTHTQDHPENEARESSLSGVEKLSNGSEEKRLALGSEVEKASLAETVFEIFGSSSFVDEGNAVSAAVDTSQMLVPEQPTLHSEEATDGCLEMPHALDEYKIASLLCKGPDIEKQDHSKEYVDLNSKVKSEIESIASPANEDYVSGIDDCKDANTSAVVQRLGDKTQDVASEEIICENNIDRETTISNARHSEDPTTSQKSDENAVVSGIKLNESVIEDFAEVSLDLPSCDTLSCSASPAHSSFMEGSEGSHQSGRTEESYPEVFKSNDAQFHSDQDVASKKSDNRGNHTPSGTANLSDGEILSSSDSEVTSACTSTKSKHRPDKRHKKANHTNNKSLRKRSRSKERTKRSHKEESRPTRQDRDRHGKDLDRAKFFEEKLRILNERRKGHTELDRKTVSHHGSRLRIRSDDHECTSLQKQRLESTVQRVTDERKSLKPAEHRDRHRTSKDDRHRESRLARDLVSSSRHAASGHSTSARRHDSDHRMKSPPRSKTEKGRRTPEDKRRDRRREHRR